MSRHALRRACSDGGEAHRRRVRDWQVIGVETGAEDAGAKVVPVHAGEEVAVHDVAGGPVDGGTDLLVAAPEVAEGRASRNEVRFEHDGPACDSRIGDLLQEKIGRRGTHLLAGLADGRDRDRALGREVVVVVAGDGDVVGHGEARGVSSRTWMRPIASRSDAATMPSYRASGLR